MWVVLDYISEQPDMFSQTHKREVGVRSTRVGWQFGRNYNYGAIYRRSSLKHIDSLIKSIFWILNQGLFLLSDVHEIISFKSRFTDVNFCRSHNTMYVWLTNRGCLLSVFTILGNSRIMWNPFQTLR